MRHPGAPSASVPEPRPHPSLPAPPPQHPAQGTGDQDGWAGGEGSPRGPGPAGPEQTRRQVALETADVCLRA